MEKTAKVTGMHCASCAAGIETFLKSQKGIEDAEVEYSEKQLKIEYNEDAELEKIWKQITEMGYEVEK
ncbi:MAG: heavy-metal-associated domain-containing protein [Candidatus Nanohalobium sp.]